MWIFGTRQLPFPAPTWVVSGVVTWEDEHAAERIEVRALGVTGARAPPTAQPGAPCPHANGGFAIALWQGHRYRFVVALIADRADAGRRPGRGPRQSAAFTNPHRHSPGAVAADLSGPRPQAFRRSASGRSLRAEETGRIRR